VVQNKNLYLMIGVMFVTSGCAVQLETQTPQITLPEFVTATLPASPIPQLTNTSVPPTAAATLPPVGGTTTTQVNVRAETSTASANLGLIPQFTAIQILGKDSSGNWFKIVYSDSPSGSGWVRAEYVNVGVAVEIPVLETEAGSGSGLNALVLQRINVRSGPGLTFDALGILNPNDVAVMTGRDSNSEWIQIEYPNGNEGKGWVTAKYLDSTDLSSLPEVIRAAQTQEPAPEQNPTPENMNLPALQDGDTQDSPLAKANLGAAGVRSFELSGDISSPHGDNEDWIGIISSQNVVALKLLCTNGIVEFELWHANSVTNSFSLDCNNEYPLMVISGNNYTLRIFLPNSGDFIHVSYKLELQAAQN